MIKTIHIENFTEYVEYKDLPRMKAFKSNYDERIRIKLNEDFYLQADCYTEAFTEARHLKKCKGYCPIAKASFEF